MQTLSHCELITDEGIRHLGSGPCSTEHLAVLELDNCPLITDQSLEHLHACHNLQRIELYDCQLITRNGIKRLRVSDGLPLSGCAVGCDPLACGCGVLVSDSALDRVMCRGRARAARIRHGWVIRRAALMG